MSTQNLIKMLPLILKKSIYSTTMMVGSNNNLMKLCRSKFLIAINALIQTIGFHESFAIRLDHTQITSSLNLIYRNIFNYYVVNHHRYLSQSSQILLITTTSIRLLLSDIIDFRLGNSNDQDRLKSSGMSSHIREQ